MTQKEKQANDSYRSILSQESKYIEQYIKNMYMIAGKFEYYTTDEIFKWSKDAEIYEFDISNIFENAQKDKYKRFVDISTGEVFTLLIRTYRLIIIGTYIIEAENKDIKSNNTPVGNCGISVTSIFMQIILNNIVTLHDIANNKQDYKFNDSKFSKQYNRVINDINSSKCIEEIIKRIASEYENIKTWMPRDKHRYDIDNLYNIIKHGFDAYDFFERNDRQTLIDNIENNIKNISSGMNETPWFNDKCKELLEISKRAFETNLCVLNDILK